MLIHFHFLKQEHVPGWCRTISNCLWTRTQNSRPLFVDIRWSGLAGYAVADADADADAAYNADAATGATIKAGETFIRYTFIRYTFIHLYLHFRQGEVPMAANPPVLSAVLPPSPVKKVEPALALIWVNNVDWTHFPRLPVCWRGHPNCSDWHTSTSCNGVSSPSL